VPDLPDLPDLLAERDGVRVTLLDLDVPDDVAAAVAFVERLDAELDGAPVDEAELLRLRALADGQTDPHPRWRPVLARRDAEVVGYAGLVLPAEDDGDAVGDVAVARDTDGHPAVLAVLLDGLGQLAGAYGANAIEAWLRHGSHELLAAAAGAGFAVRRRLGVLGRHLDVDVVADERSDVEVDGVTVRASRGPSDDEAVVEVLAAAYDGTDDGGWDLERFRERRGWSWFRDEDLLLAVDDATGRVLGLHWLKRRDEVTGEVYNLAVHPDGQGRRLGPLLLAAGLEHLAEVGCRDVVLWVDLANERAVRLYHGQGFTTRWEDVAFERSL
jgi:mycothiol synthase